MKLGFVSSAMPLDPEKCVHGIYRRMGMFIRAMRKDWEMEMLFYVDPNLDVSPDFRANMERLLASHWDAKLRIDICRMAPARPEKSRWTHYIQPALSIKSYPSYSQVTRPEQIAALSRLLSKDLDAVFVHRLQCMVPVLLSKQKHPNIYFDLDDIEHVAFARSIRQPPLWRLKWLYYLRLPVLALLEIQAIRFAHTTFVCSEKDRRYLSQVWRHRNVVVIPNAIDVPKEGTLPSQPILMFIGSFLHPPNAVGADFLVSKVWPKILEKLPRAQLLIAGSRPEAIPSFKKRPRGVRFLGFVKDLDSLYRDVKVVCCPIFAGGGTRIKILEAAAFGKPVVSTTIGAEGLDMKDGREILLRDDAEGFADACIQLLTDSDEGMIIGGAGRQVVAQRYETGVIAREIRRKISLFTALRSRTKNTCLSYNEQYGNRSRL